jgi:malate dehydrogenase
MEVEMRKRITVVGAGHVGSTTAQRIVEAGLGDVVLIDIVEGLPQGLALDLVEDSPIMGYDTNILGTNDYKDIQDSDIVVITAGLPRKPGMSREDLLLKNAEIVRSCALKVKEYSKDAIVIVLSNPLDIMTYLTYRLTGFPRERVIGQAGALDSTRFRSFIAKELNVSVLDISAMVLGGHGDAMLPLVRYSTVSGVPISELLPEEKIDAIVARTRKAGGEIVNYLKTGSAYFSPAASVLQMVDAIVNDRKKIIPCSAYLDGEYGLNDVYAGVPMKLGEKGMEEIIELKLTEEEKGLFKHSADIVKKNIEILREKGYSI